MMTQPMVISGPSGVGKSTLLHRLLKEYPGQFQFSVSHTTRQKREKEIDGKHYHYISREQFLSDIKENLFIEHTEYASNLYGTSLNSVEVIRKSGKICILDIDSEGVKKIKKTDMNPIYIFIQPPSFEELVNKLIILQTYKQTNKQTNKQTDKQQTNRQTNKQTKF
eukprot:TRINITY_DN2749_c0_g1_i10.p1 TRINITY_DN2749_c0_g1~~TRINITY_DN2749_c0_g1_i10.p1  ORF type:complete len:166 (-),score=49.45 TRINITY_DN2749_c0_g1_i10:319-816(-)